MKSYREFVISLFHIGPLSTIVLIKTITLSVIYCSLMWWPPTEIGGLFNLSFFLISSGMVMFNFFSAISNGPGFLPLGWKPNDPTANSKLQFCTVCKGYKAPRAHHCRKCGRCVMKLDHHCPWINCCVGHHNHAYFVSFLISAAVGCSHATVILVCSLYRAMYRTYFVYHGANVPFVYLGFYGFVWCLFSCGCAVGVALGVGVLLYYQLKVILRNETTIEEWIIEKANYRRKICPRLPPFRNPYDLGWKDNFKFVMNLSCLPIGPGYDWPVADGCNQYSMTIEQILQKNDKRRRTKECTVVENYSGSWCPISKGVAVFFHPPCSDEPRISVNKEDRILVSRWKKYWIYGEIFTNEQHPTNNSLPRIKGWLPRRCAIEVMNSSLSQHSDSETEQVEVGGCIKEKKEN